MKALKKNGTLIAILAIAAIAIFLFSMQSGTKLSEQLVVIDYDAEGNIIQQKTVDLSQSTRSGLPPAEWASDEDYVEINIPAIPADAVKRDFKLIVTNTGNVPIDIEVRDGGMHGDYFIQLLTTQ